MLIGAPVRSPLSANDWRIGNDVGLSRGTQIRVGPSTRFCYHTVVPEDNWTVRVIGGPRTDENNNIWWDTSRAAAGDSSGGTGWVRKDQADVSPAPDDGGVYCPPGSPSGPSPAPAASPSSTPGTSVVCRQLSVHLPKFIYDTQQWWASESVGIKIAVMVGALLLLFASGRAGAAASPVFTVLIRAILAGILLAGLGDLFRSSWIDFWYQITSGNCGIEPTLLLLVGPPLVWGLILLFGVASRLLSIVVTILLIMFLLTLVTPQVISGIVDALMHLLGSQPKPSKP